MTTPDTGGRMKATFIKKIEGFTGDACLYKLSEKIKYESKKTSYVIVSATVVPFSGFPFSGAETYVFPANKKGEIVSWAELEGSFRGGLDHRQALENMGIEIEDSP